MLFFSYTESRKVRQSKLFKVVLQKNAVTTKYITAIFLFPKHIEAAKEQKASVIIYPYFFSNNNITIKYNQCEHINLDLRSCTFPNSSLESVPMSCL